MEISFLILFRIRNSENKKTESKHFRNKISFISINMLYYDVNLNKRWTQIVLILDRMNTHVWNKLFVKTLYIA